MSILTVRNQKMNAYAPVPFWSWNNALDKKELLRQIDDMLSTGCGGFIIHARMGLREEYLSEEWFSRVELCLNAAKERGMLVWIYDENGWPSGFAGGKLLEDENNLVQYLVRSKEPAFDPNAFAVFVAEGGGYRRVTAPVQGVTAYHTVRMRRSPSYVDILNPAVVEKFVALTHEEYYKRFRSRFGKELTGFFTDEPQYIRGETPYSTMLEGYFKEHYGEDVRDKIIAIFEDGEQYYEYRVRYYKALNELYVENYYRYLYEWCEKHGCRLTGHSIQENTFCVNMCGSAGVAATYEYEHVPAIDQLTRGESAKLSARLVGSAAAQTGKKQIMTETFACCGYSATPKILKAVGDRQYVHGVNYLCHHLYAYSLAGQGKSDHPPCFSDHIPWHGQLKDFNTYFTRLGYLLANSSAQVNCCVISPLSSVYLRYDVKNEEPAMETDRSFWALQAALNKHAVEYEIADERLAQKYGAVKGEKLVVGERQYSFVIVPDCKNLSQSTKALLQKYLAAGGKLLALNRPAYTDGKKDDWSFLQSNITLEEIARHNAIALEGDGKVEYTYRVGKNFSFLFIVNPENESANVRVPEGFSKLDLVNMALTECDREIVLGAGESVVLTPERGKPAVTYQAPREIVKKLRCIGASQNMLPLDNVYLSTDGKNYGAEEPLEEAFDRLLRTEYNGKLFVKFPFEVKDRAERLLLRREKGNYLSSSVNGKELKFAQSDFDINFEEADIAGAVREGRNEYVAELDFYEHPHVAYALYSPEATESLRNCLVYDTDLAPVMLLGDFSLDHRAVAKQTLPESASAIDAQGYQHFAGAMTFSCGFYGESPLAKLRLSGEFCAAEVKVNGRSVGSLFQNDSIEFFANEGEENYLEIKLFSSLRNAMGPFHWIGGEDGIAPVHFTMRGMWKDGKCDIYTEEYKTVPFGIENALLYFGAYEGK